MNVVKLPEMLNLTPNRKYFHKTSSTSILISHCNLTEIIYTIKCEPIRVKSEDNVILVCLNSDLAGFLVSEEVKMNIIYKYQNYYISNRPTCSLIS